MPEKFKNQAELFAQIPDAKSISSYFPRIVRNRHKYQAGYVVGFSGSKVFKGAPKLAGLAALRAGAGIVRVFHQEDIGESPYSLICQKWEEKNWEKEITRASAVFIGPGIGKGHKIQKLLKNLRLPVVLDADAIQEGIKYPEKAILTPHRGEVLRLLGISKDTLEEDLLARCQKWANHTNCILVLKGAPTWIFSKGKASVIIPRGDPGMAKSGSGDVLTGVIAALLSQKAPPLHAAILGVFLHSVAGEKAALEKTSYGMIAEDIIEKLSHAIMEHRHCVVGFKPIHKMDDSFL